MCWIAILTSTLLPVAPTELPDEIRKAGVDATARVSDPSNESTATGVIIGLKNRDLYVLTAGHVVTPKSKPTVELFKHDKLPKPVSSRDKGEVVYLATDSDLAIIRLEGETKGLTFVRLTPPTHADHMPGKSWAIGCDSGGEPRIIEASILAKKLVRKRDGTSAFFWQAKADAVHGRSGGPLLDGEGRLLGICSGTQEGMTYYCHPDEIRAAIRAARLGFLIGDKDKR